MNNKNTNGRIHTNSRSIIRSFKAKADAQRSSSEKFADWLVGTFGSPQFLIFNVVFFTAWLISNTGIIKGLVPFDPFPFGLLTTIVSLEAIILAIFVLISQNRSSKVDDLREEIDLQVDTLAEREVTKILEFLVLILEKQGVDVTNDKELQSMLRATDMEKIEKALEKEMY